MQSEATIEPYVPTCSVVVGNPREGVIYLVPSTSGTEGRPAYMGADALLLKQAVANGVRVEYALPEEEREFVEHFSAAIDIIGLAVAVVGLVPSTIQGIHALIELAAARRGYTGEAVRKAKVELKIDYINASGTEAHGVKIKGDAEGVVEALKVLSGGS